MHFTVAGSTEQAEQRCKRKFAEPRSNINFIPGKVVQRNKVRLTILALTSSQVIGVIKDFRVDLNIWQNHTS